MGYEVKVPATNYKKNAPTMYLGYYHCDDIEYALRKNHGIVNFQRTGTFVYPETSEILIAIEFKNEADAMICKLIYGV